MYQSVESRQVIKDGSGCNKRLLVEFLTITDAKNTSGLAIDVIVFFMTAGTPYP
jgi:hypothetical protein